MSYDYQRERPRIFSEDGVSMLLKIRDAAREHLKRSGAVTAGKLIAVSGGGSTDTMLACIDYLVERGEIRRVTADDSTWAQHQVFCEVRP